MVKKGHKENARSMEKNKGEGESLREKRRTNRKKARKEIGK